MKTNFRLRNRLIRFKSFNLEKLSAMIIRNYGQSVVGIILRMIPAMQGRVTSGIATLTKVMLSRISKIAQTQGIPGLCKYLKAASVLLQQSLCGYKINDFSPRVSRTNRGIPRVLPVTVRRFIRAGNHFYMKWSLTCLSLFRDLLYDSPVKVKSITDPFSGNPEIVKKVIGFIPRFTKLFVVIPEVRRSLLENKFSYLPIVKSSPQALPGLASTHPLVLVKSALAFDSQMRDALLTLAKISAPYIHVKPSIIEGDNEYKIVQIPNPEPPVIGWIDRIRHLRDFIHRSIKLEFKHFNIGKLGLKQEAAGKMRVFAMVDPWTQLILRPFHLALFRILRKHKMDGTFNQLRPLSRAWGFKALFSMDLSSATDRLPMSIQVPLIKSVLQLTEDESLAWKHVLVGRAYLVPKTNKEIYYSVGQPMGALSSWAMLALTHHLIVQCAAWSAGFPQTRLFQDYAVLGDDIVIFDKKIARSYHKLILGLGVECNLAKSILSYKGIGLEFAKKTFIEGVNISPTPLKELKSSLEGPISLIQYGKTYGLSLPQLLTVAGMGYKVKGSCNRPFWKINNYKVKLIVMATLMVDPDKVMLLFERSFGNKPSVITTLTAFKQWLETTTMDLNNKLLEQISLSMSTFKDTKFTTPSGDGEIWIIPKGKTRRGLLRSLFKLIYRPYMEKTTGLFHEGLLAIQNKVLITIWNLPDTPQQELIKAFYNLLTIEQRVSSLNLETFQMRRDTSPITGLSPKVERILRSYRVIFEQVVQPALKEQTKELEEKSSTESTSTPYKESSFFLSMNLIRIFFLKSGQLASKFRTLRIINKPLPKGFVTLFGFRTLIWFWMGEMIWISLIGIFISYIGFLGWGIVDLIISNKMSMSSMLLLLRNSIDPSWQLMYYNFYDTFFAWLYPVYTPWYSSVIDYFVKFNLSLVSIDLILHWDHVSQSFSFAASEDHSIVAILGCSMGVLKVYLLDYLGQFYLSLVTGLIHPSTYFSSMAQNTVVITVLSFKDVIVEYLKFKSDYIWNGISDIGEISPVDESSPSSSPPILDQAINTLEQEESKWEGTRVGRLGLTLIECKPLWSFVGTAVAWWVIKKTVSTSVKLITG